MSFGSIFVKIGPLRALSNFSVKSKTIINPATGGTDSQSSEKKLHTPEV